MIRMILADDEPVITAGIQKLVDWKSLGIQVEGVYENGRDAMDGIISLKPELALLDISMPKQNGIEILRQIKELELSTKVIFISGFQDFQYARDALTYGAVDYLLKPVIKDELVAAVEKSIRFLPFIQQQSAVQVEEAEAKEAQYGKLVEIEETTYRPCLAEILYKEQKHPQEQKLIRFSVISAIENHLEQWGLGIVFTKNEHIILVLKGVDEEQVRQVLYDLMEDVEQKTRYRLGVIVGEQYASMGQIPSAYGRCLERYGYFYFADQMKIPIIPLEGTVYAKPYTMEELDACRNRMLDTIAAQDMDEMKQSFDQFRKQVCVLSGGKKEDACFYFCTAIRIAGEKLKALGVEITQPDMQELLEQGRRTVNYGGMAEFYRQCLEQYFHTVRSSVASNDKKEIMRAKEYIESHYKENLTLEVLAGEIHMNPYYFSSYFKKSSGENFKDYLNKVRMRHALTLLVSTDMRSYEIASEVGFRDARSFADLFQRMNGETPASYRKRVKE